MAPRGPDGQWFPKTCPWREKPEDDPCGTPLDDARGTWCDDHREPAAARSREGRNARYYDSIRDEVEAARRTAFDPTGTAVVPPALLIRLEQARQRLHDAARAYEQAYRGEFYDSDDPDGKARQQRARDLLRHEADSACEVMRQLLMRRQPPPG